MGLQSNLVATLASVTALVCTTSVAVSHDQSGHMMQGQHAGMMHGRMQRPGMGRGMKHGSMMHRGHHGGMMHRQRSRGMMMRGHRPHNMMAGHMFGQRVTKMMNLSLDDVRNYLEWRLKEIGNKRLKVGEVKVDAGAIIADIATVDDSLVQRLSINRRTGEITYTN